jgi:hypothetical protein
MRQQHEEDSKFTSPSHISIKSTKFQKDIHIELKAAIKHNEVSVSQHSPSHPKRLRVIPKLRYLIVAKNAKLNSTIRITQLS